MSVTTSRNRSPSEAEIHSSRNRSGPRCPSGARQSLQQLNPLEALVVAFLVVAVAGMAAADQHAVGSLAEGSQHELRIESARST